MNLVLWCDASCLYGRVVFSYLINVLIWSGNFYLLYQVSIWCGHFLLFLFILYTCTQCFWGSYTGVIPEHLGHFATVLIDFSCLEFFSVFMLYAKLIQTEDRSRCVGCRTLFSYSSLDGLIVRMVPKSLLTFHTDMLMQKDNLI